MLPRLKFQIAPLVNEMLDKLPLTVFQSSTTRFLDPAMAGGQFVVEIIRRLRDNGHSDENIAERVWGLAEDAIDLNYAVNTKKLIGKYSIGSVEKLQEWTEMGKKFDVVIGNPPFQDGDRIDNANKLWPHFVRLGAALLEDGGYLSLIHPSSWVTPGADIGKGKTGFNILNDLFKQKQLVYANLDSDRLRAQYFSTTGSTFSWYVMQNVPCTRPTTIDTSTGQELVDLRTVDQLPRILSAASLNILAKTLTRPAFGFSDQSHEIKTDSKNGTNDSVDSPTSEFKYINYHTPAKGGVYKYSKVPHSRQHLNKVMVSLSGNYYAKPDAGSMGYTGMCLVLFTDHIHTAASVLNSKLYQFLVHNTKFSGFNPRATVLSFPAVDLTRSWTDEELYKHFNLTQEEIDLIEKTIK